METIVLAVALFGLAFAGMAIGVIVTGKKELKGSCGGPGVNADCCMTCPDKPKCDHGDLDEEFAAVAHRGGGSHPALSQVPSAASSSGQPVATR